MTSNTLFFGDNLDILRHNIADASVDLVYLDPPFNSNRSYNLLFKDEKGAQAPSQIRAFEDTWTWAGASEIYFETIGSLDTPEPVRVMLETLYKLLSGSEMMAYLAMMTPRLIELHRVLKPTGSLYLHCDPTASHYLRIVLDTIFKPENFRNEIVWKRTNVHNDSRQGSIRYGRVHDVLLFYARSKTSTWNTIYEPLSDNTRSNLYGNVEKETGRDYSKSDITAAKGGGDTSYEWKGWKPDNGRYWAYSKANIEQFDREGRLVYTSSGRPYLKRYLDESPGTPLQDWWGDIPIMRGTDERLGYPTQKPLALLKRIIAVSSNPGDVVLELT